jgi:hypothetical protein
MGKVAEWECELQANPKHMAHTEMPLDSGAVLQPAPSKERASS